jgi:hypothetical protein
MRLRREIKNQKLKIRMTYQNAKLQEQPSLFLASYDGLRNIRQ